MREMWLRLPYGVRLALIMGLLWGGSMMLITPLIHGHLHIPVALHVLTWAVMGLLFGFTMSAALMLQFAIQVTRWGRVSFRDIASRQAQELRLALPPEEALSAARAAARALRFKDLAEERGGFSTEKRLPLQSIGDTLSVRVQPAPGGSLLRIDTQPFGRLLPFDQARGVIYTDKIVARLRKRHPVVVVDAEAPRARDAAQPTRRPLTQPTHTP